MASAEAHALAKGLCKQVTTLLMPQVPGAAAGGKADEHRAAAAGAGIARQALRGRRFARPGVQHKRILYVFSTLVDSHSCNSLHVTCSELH